MDELIDILDEHGNATGQSVLKSEAHRLGLYHATVHVWCYSPDGDLLLQLRGEHKKTFPSKWDVSVAGHIASGERIETAAVREVAEEIGIVITEKDLQKIAVFKTETRHTEHLIDNEFNHTFLYALDPKIPLTRQESEVEALTWCSMEEFKALITDDTNTLVPDSGGRYEKVIDAVISRL